MTEPKTKKRFSLKRISLSSLLVLMTVFCVLVAIWASQVQPLIDQYAAMKVVKLRGGGWRARPIEATFWQKWFLEPEAFQEVYSVNLNKAKLEEDDLPKLGALRNLKSLYLEGSNFSDEGMGALSSIRGLEELDLRYCSLTDAGIKRLGDKPQLRMLNLNGSDISDESIERLSSFSRLETLYIRWTRISAEGSKQLQENLPDCQVHYIGLQD